MEGLPGTVLLGPRGNCGAGVIYSALGGRTERTHRRNRHGRSFLDSLFRLGRSKMITSTQWFGSAGLFASLVLSWVSTALAQEKTPFPTLGDKHVYVAGVPDQFRALETQINELERSSPQTYYVVVIKQAGPGPKAAIQYAEELFDRWRSQAAKEGRPFDADRSILVVLAVDNQRIAVHPGASCATQFGLTPARIERELIKDVFIPYAKKDQYSEGLGALLAGLLNQTNDAIAARDHETARAPVKITASPSSRTGAQRSTTPAQAVERCAGSRPSRRQARNRSSDNGPAASRPARPLVVRLENRPGHRGPDRRGSLADDCSSALVGISSRPLARGQSDQGSQVEGRRRDGSPRFAQGTPQAAADLA